MANRPGWLTILGVALFGAAPLRAQQASDFPRGAVGRFELTILAGYRMEGSIRSETGDATLDLENHATFGIAFDLRVDRAGDLEIQYSYTDSPGLRTTSSPPTSQSLDVVVHDVIFGILVNLAPPERRVRPYVGLGLGFSVVDPSGNAPSLTRFAFSLSGGIKAYPSEHYGLRLEVRWVPVYLYSIPTGGYDCNFGGLWCTPAGNAQLFEQVDFRLGASLRF
jgi:opacity protein-like surface antigen